MKFDGFDWDEANGSKCQKHGVPLAEIEDLFRGTPLVAIDAVHSQSEKRFLAIGRTSTDRNLFVVFTWRHRDLDRLIRPVSARYMHKKEVDSLAQRTP